jgi:hypothetical protein
MSTREQERDIICAARGDTVDALRCGAGAQHRHNRISGDLQAARRGRAGRDRGTTDVKRCAAQVLDPPVARR